MEKHHEGSQYFLDKGRAVCLMIAQPASAKKHTKGGIKEKKCYQPVSEQGNNNQPKHIHPFGVLKKIKIKRHEQAGYYHNDGINETAQNILRRRGLLPEYSFFV